MPSKKLLGTFISTILETEEFKSHETGNGELNNNQGGK